MIKSPRSKLQYMFYVLRTYRVIQPLSSYSRAAQHGIWGTYNATHVLKSRVPASTSILVRSTVYVRIVIITEDYRLLLLLIIILPPINFIAYHRSGHNFPHDERIRIHITPAISVETPVCCGRRWVGRWWRRNYRGELWIGGCQSGCRCNTVNNQN